MAKIKKQVSILEKVNELANILEGIGGDADKFDSGNSAAGTRVRKAMMELRKGAQDIRAAISTIKDQRKG